MFAEIHSSQSDSRVHVVGWDDDGVDIFLALEHFAKVGCSARLSADGWIQLSMPSMRAWALTGSNGAGIHRLAGLGVSIRFLRPLDTMSKVLESLWHSASRPRIARHVLAGEIDQIGAAHSADATAAMFSVSLGGVIRDETLLERWRTPPPARLRSESAARDCFLFAHA